MSNNRKVQVDIYRLLKKTGEGLDVYEELFEKFENAPNPTIKERLEGELKKEIKKLQRQREQIKSFIASSDVKDTKQLESFRKKIETKMEAFKVCEREVKTKTFSKEGLALAANDWSEAPLAQTEAWLKSVIEEGRKKIEIIEYELQKQQGGAARSSRRAPSKGGVKPELQIRLEKLNIHIFKWESLLRMVSNEEVDLEEVDALHDTIEKLLEDDVDLAFISSMTMYKDFDIPEPKAKPVSEDPAEEKLEEEKQDAPLRSKSRSNQDPSVAAGVKGSRSTSTTPKLAVTPSPLANPSAGNDYDKESVGKGAKAASAATNNRSTTMSPSKASLNAYSAVPTTFRATSGNPIKDDDEGSQWMDESIDNANDDTFGVDAMELANPGTLAEMASATMKMMPPSDWEGRKLELGKTHALEANAVVPPAPMPVPAPSPLRNTGTSNVAAQVDPGRVASPSVTLEKEATTTLTTPKSAYSPKNTKCSYNATATLALLDMSLANLPHTLDVERQRPYEPPNAIDPIPYFPQDVHPVLSSREIYHHFDLETLFFIFYYHQKSYQQYFASKELKAHSFRFHTELKRWYQRREKPKETTAKSERGAYTYFDYEDTWQKQTVDDFVFEYKYLEDELI